MEREGQLAGVPVLELMDVGSQRLNTGHDSSLVRGMGQGLEWRRTVGHLYGWHAEQGLSLYLCVLFIHLFPAGFRENLCAAARQTVLIQIAFRVGD